MTAYIFNIDHYKEVLSRVRFVKHMLWVGTADIKDLYVEVRLIHAKESGPNFREDFDKYPVLYDRLERALCFQFDEVGIGKHCKKCKLKGSCPDPY